MKSKTLNDNQSLERSDQWLHLLVQTAAGIVSRRCSIKTHTGAGELIVVYPIWENRDIERSCERGQSGEELLSFYPNSGLPKGLKVVKATTDLPDLQVTLCLCKKKKSCLTSEIVLSELDSLQYNINKCKIFIAHTHTNKEHALIT